MWLILIKVVILTPDAEKNRYKEQEGQVSI